MSKLKLSRDFANFDRWSLEAASLLASGDPECFDRVRRMHTVAVYALKPWNANAIASHFHQRYERAINRRGIGKGALLETWIWQILGRPDCGSTSLGKVTLEQLHQDLRKRFPR